MGHSAEREATSTTAGRFGALVDQQAFCGQQQAHWSHRWVTQSGFYAACSGKACSCPLPPGVPTPPAEPGADRGSES